MDDITEPSEWQNSKLPSLQPLDFALRCQICKEFLTAPLLTPCGHSFCSLCVRRCIRSEAICPVCRSPVKETDLRKNTALEDAVLAFANARREIMDMATKEPEPVSMLEQSSKISRIALLEDEGSVSSSLSSNEIRRSMRSTKFAGSMDIRKTRKRSREIPDSEDDTETVRKSPSPPTIEPGLLAIEDSGEKKSEMPVIGLSKATASRQCFNGKTDDGLAECPICLKRLPVREIESTHIEACINGTSTTPKPSPKVNRILPFSQASPSKRQIGLNLFHTTGTSSRGPSGAAPPQRLPKLNYHSMKETALRNKLSELGIPNHGSKSQMQARHAEWVMMVNANADAKYPRSKRELLVELDSWERASKTKLTKPDKGDFDKEQWMANNKDQYAELLANARKRRKTGPAPENKTGLVDSNTTPSIVTSETDRGLPGTPDTGKHLLLSYNAEGFHPDPSGKTEMRDVDIPQQPSRQTPTPGVKGPREGSIAPGNSSALPDHALQQSNPRASISQSSSQTGQLRVSQHTSPPCGSLTCNEPSSNVQSSQAYYIDITSSPPSSQQHVP